MNNLHNLIAYQIYPRSFCDSDGNGIGDIAGIIQKLDYIQSLGVNAVWISPCFKSPNEDNGYDISDYCDIMDEFGTLEDCKRMISEMHKRGIKVIFDFVANHTSTEHKWFQQACSSKDNPYHDYYYWFDSPPNDWSSVFGGSAWEYCESVGQYYLHTFAVHQADVNWENPKVREEFKKIIDFWVDFGVDGFRCDVLDQISKDFAQGLNGNGPRLHEFIHYLFGGKNTQLFTVGECWGANVENIKQLCAPEREELTCVFQFDHLCLNSPDKFLLGNPSLREVCQKLALWQELSQKEGLNYTLFFENHDQPRSISRFGNSDYRYESATLLATLILTLRGIPFIYQGQELGMVNAAYDTIDGFCDVESLNYYRVKAPEIGEKEALRRINNIGRDNARRMIPWDGDDHPGWIAPQTDRAQINAAADMAAERSVYRYYQKLIHLRRTMEDLQNAPFKLLELDDRHFVYTRGNILVICNFERENTIDIKKYDIKDVLLFNGDVLSCKFAPYQAVVAEI